MAITYTGSNGLFTRLGKLFQVRKVMNTFQDTLRDEIEDVIDEFIVADMYQIGGLPASIKTFDLPMKPMHSAIAGHAAKMIIETVRAGLLKEPKGFRDALEMLIIDMVAESQSVEAASFITAGDGDVTSALSAAHGTVIVNNSQPRKTITTDTSWQMIRSEVLNVECIEDESSGIPLGREVFRITGAEPKIAFDAGWPSGSGLNKHLSVTSAKGYGNNRGTSPGAGENILVNSDFQAWATSVLPSRWVEDGGTSANHAEELRHKRCCYRWQELHCVVPYQDRCWQRNDWRWRP